MHELLWITPTEALVVALATTGMYLAMLLLVRILEQRVLSGMSLGCAGRDERPGPAHGR